MTLMLSAQTAGSIWLVADRRLSVAGRPWRDDAKKIATLRTTDGAAIIGYAGLGATAANTEPSDWIARVLRGRNLSLERSLDILAGAVKREFPRHVRAGSTPHVMLIPALLNGRPRVYLMSLVPSRGAFVLRCNPYIAGGPLTSLDIAVPLALGGSGERALAGDKSWRRPLLRMVRAFNEGRVHAHTVADYLAALAYEAHLTMIRLRDRTVGPQCIVAWMYGTGGGGFQSYIAGKRNHSGLLLPTIMHGADVSAIMGAISGPLFEHLVQQREARKQGRAIEPLDDDAIDALLARLPKGPDEKLR